MLKEDIYIKLTVFRDQHNLPKIDNLYHQDILRIKIILSNLKTVHEHHLRIIKKTYTTNFNRGLKLKKHWLG